jgi:nucleoid DNA-binding protein
MTRSDLVEELAARFSQLTHRDAEFAVKAILDAMSDALVRGHRIEIRGFGSFSINRRPPTHRAQSALGRERGDPGKARATLQAGQGPARSRGPAYRRTQQRQTRLSQTGAAMLRHPP